MKRVRVFVPLSFFVSHASVAAALIRNTCRKV
nr:MAG TPA: hypothetical protein [Inoviridae sp.]